MERTITQNSALYLLHHRFATASEAIRREWRSSNTIRLNALHAARSRASGDVPDVRRLHLGER